MGAFKYVVFSDVDGTLVHYPEHLQRPTEEEHVSEDINNNEDTMLYLPPSKTGTRGIISARTLVLCQLLRYGRPLSEYSTGRIQVNTAATEFTATSSTGAFQRERIANGGVPFVVISGMRTTTLFQRLPYLPRADAYVSESGGRIFYPCPIETDGKGEQNETMEGLVKGLVVRPVSYRGCSDEDLVPFSLREDMEWRKRISESSAAGEDGFNESNGEEEFPIHARNGKLWEFANTLIDRGFHLDSRGYAASFRVNRKHQHKNGLNFDVFLDKCSRMEGIPDGLNCSTNLGCVDIYPAISGKKNGCDYLVRKFLQGSASNYGLKSRAFCMCDDDNDIEMALACRAAFFPGVTSESVRRIVEELRGSDVARLVVTEDVGKGVIEADATEAALNLLLKEVRKEI